MAEIFLITIFMAAATSLISYIYCWHDIKTGRPHIISLRQITNIMDRNRLTALFGKPEPGYYYVLSPQMLVAFTRKYQTSYYSEVGADTMCLIGSYMYMTGQLAADRVWWFIALAGFCQVVNFCYSIMLVRRWAHQFREEMNDIDD